MVCWAIQDASDSGDEAARGLRKSDETDFVGRLVDVSLVQVIWDAGQGARFRLLETMRAYAGE